MKNTTWKKIVSILLVAALVIGGLQLNARRVAAGTTPQVSDVAYQQLGTNTEPSVIYNLSGGSAQVGTKTDIVLAIDLSGSMGYANGKHSKTSRLDNAKVGAVNFVNELLGDDKITKNFVRIALVTYSSYATVKVDLTNDRQALLEAISGLGADGATNIDSAIEKTVDGVFDNRTADEKENNKTILVLLADGEPTKANGEWVKTTDVVTFKDFNGRYRGIWDWNYDYYIYFEANGSLYRAKANYDYWNEVFNYSNDTLEKLADSTTKTIGNGSDFSMECELAAKVEADNSGIDSIYTILFGKTNDTNAIRTMKSIASDDKKYFTAGDSENAISGVYTSIANTIKDEIAGKDARLEITASEFVDYVGYNKAANETEEKVTTKDGKIIWHIGDLDSEEKTYSPQINFKLKDNVTPLTLIEAAEAGNGQVSLEKDANGNITKIKLNVTAEVWLYYTDNSGKEIPKKVNNLYVREFNAGTDFYKYTVIYKTVDTPAGTSEEKKTVVDYALPNATVTPARYTLAQLEITDTAYDPNYTIEAFTVTANNQTEYVEIPARYATVNYYQINDEGTDVDDKITDKTARYGDPISFVDVPDPQNYVASGAGISYTWTGEWDKPATVAQPVVSVKAKYDGLSIYEVVFKYVDGIENKTVTLYKSKDSVLKEAEIPSGFNKTKTETTVYSFDTWLDGEAEADLTAKITENKTFVAKYSEEDRMYDVTFKAIKDGQETVIGTDSVKYNAVPDADEAEAEAKKIAESLTDSDSINKYAFTGWDPTVTNVTKDGVVYWAQIGKNGKHTYTVKFYDEDEETFFGEYTVEAGDNTQEWPTPNKGTKIFVEYVDSDGEVAVYTNITDDKVFYATYREADKATFTFYKSEVGTEDNKVAGTVSYNELTEAADLKGKEPDGKKADEKKDFFFDQWVTYIETVAVEDIQPEREMLVRVDEYSATATTAPNDAAVKVVSYDEYLEKYYVKGEVKDVSFYPTYTAIEKFDLTVKYVDQNDKEIKDSYTNKFKAEEEIELRPDKTITVDGVEYQLNDGQLDEEGKIVVSKTSDNDQTVVIKYTKKTTVKFIVNEVPVYDKTATVGTAIEKPVDPATVVTEIEGKKYTISFKGWSLDKVNVVEKVAEKFGEEDLTYVALFNVVEKKDDTPVNVDPVIDPPAPAPSFILPPWQPTTTPTEDPTPEPTPVVEIDETETPEGAPEEEEPTPTPEVVDVDVNETPEGAPDEEIDIDDIETPEGDLPQTGVASTGVFFGIGAACIVIGGLAIFKTRRKEEM